MRIRLKNELPKIYLDLKNDNADKVITICRSYEPYFDIDVKCGQMEIDPFSWLGVFGLVNHTVQVIPILGDKVDDLDTVMKLYEELKPYGAYIKGEEK